jgi:hypothetical protein
MSCHLPAGAVRPPLYLKRHELQLKPTHLAFKGIDNVQPVVLLGIDASGTKSVVAPFINERLTLTRRLRVKMVHGLISSGLFKIQAKIRTDSLVGPEQVR